MTSGSIGQELSAALKAQRNSIEQIDLQLASSDLDEATRVQLLGERESLGLTYILAGLLADD